MLTSLQSLSSKDMLAPEKTASPCTAEMHYLTLSMAIQTHHIIKKESINEGIPMFMLFA